MTPEEILPILNRPYDKKNFPMLERWKDVYYGMSLHTTGACPRYKSLKAIGDTGWIEPAYYYGDCYQNIFEYRLFSRHPRESEDTRQWRFSQYKPLTRAPFQQIIDVITGAIFQDSNYSIQIPDEADNAYIWGNNFEGYDLVGWFANIGIPNMIEDPNGLIVRMPVYRFDEQQGERVEVGIYFINSKDIIFHNGRDIVFCKDGYAYHFDSNVIWRYTRDESEKKYYLADGDEEGYYAHLFNKMPADVAGGIWNTQGFFDSFLMKAKAIADEFVSTYSAEQMIDKEASHPFIIMSDEECPSCNGIGDVQRDCDDCDGGKELVKCEKCHGKGTISISPADRLVVPAERMKDDMVKIVSPDVGVNKYHHEKNADIYKMILDALNLLRTEQAQSGSAKAIDQERLYQFISKISNHLFDKLIYNTLSDIIAYRNVSVVNGVLRPTQYNFLVQKPTQFQIKTAQDLLDEYKTGKESGLPMYVRQKMVAEFVDKQYSGDQIMKKKSEFILDADKTAVFSVDEKLTQQTLGIFTKEDCLFSDALPLILDKIVRDKGEDYFLNASFDKLKQDVDAAFAPMKPTINQYPDDITQSNT